MGSTRGKRVPGKKKPKSIKAKVTSKMSSKRRLSRMGKEMKKGQKGIVANYMTRSQVLRRLQITLRDFRYVLICLPFFQERSACNLFISIFDFPFSCLLNSLSLLPSLPPFLPSQAPVHPQGNLPPGPQEEGLGEGQGVLPH